MAVIEYKNVTMKYKNTIALDNISASIEGNKIVGLLGRNGAGKTSMLSLLASLRKPASGQVTIDGVITFENPTQMEKCSMVWANQTLQDSGTVEKTLKFCNDFRPEFDMAYALKLATIFGLNLTKKVNSLSQGMKATLNVICGMASRTPITVFDEAYLGMDAANRKLFYKELLNDYMSNPRTIIISTHYIQEVESLFEDVIILEEGKLMLHSSVEDIKNRAVTVIGNIDTVDRLSSKYNVINSQTLGKTKSLVMYGDFSNAQLNAFKEQGLETSKPTLQDIFIYLTEKGGGLNA